MSLWYVLVVYFSHLKGKEDMCEHQVNSSLDSTASNPVFRSVTEPRILLFRQSLKFLKCNQNGTGDIHVSLFPFMTVVGTRRETAGCVFTSILHKMGYISCQTLYCIEIIMQIWKSMLSRV
jgi:hypothetical protein